MSYIGFGAIVFKEIIIVRAALNFVLLVFLLNNSCVTVKADTVPAEGGDIQGIIISSDSNVVCETCAKDLQRIFKIITHKEIIVSTEPLAGRCIYIGSLPKEYKPNVDLHSLGDEGIYLSISPTAIICTGNGQRGIYYSVQELLYQLGYRDIWPGKYGECFPKERKLKLGKDVTIVHKPSFEMRGGHCIQVEALPGEEPKHVDVDVWVDWASRNYVNRYKAGYSETWEYGESRGYGWDEMSNHTVQDVLLPTSEFSKHPDWFSLYKGKRVAKHPSGTFAQPCVSNPEVINHFVEYINNYFKQHPRSKRFLIGACDGSFTYWCDCDKCRALDTLPIDWNLNGERTKEIRPFADRWLYFVNTIAERVEKEYPDRWIATYAYSNMYEPPVRVFPRKNVMIEMCIPGLCRKHKLFDPNCPHNRGLVKRFNQWNEISPKMAIYSYVEFLHFGVPIAFFDSADDLYKSVYGLGVRYISDEHDTTPYASPVYMGLWARLLWDVNTSPRQYIDDYCKIVYGDASGEMKRFWLYQQQVMQNSECTHRTYEDIERFTTDVIKNSLQFLDAANAKNLTYDERARVERARVAVYMAEFYVNTKRAQGGNVSAWQSVETAKNNIYEIVEEYKFPLNLSEINALGKKKKIGFDLDEPNEFDEYKLPLKAIQGRPLLALPEEWYFRTDANDVGIKERWFDQNTKLDSFQSISTRKRWDEQGIVYEGYAWYFTDVNIPETNAKSVWLLFGGVDGSWRAWIDNGFIGNSKGTANETLDKPAAVEITGKYKSGKKTRIAVRVHSDRGVGGIWKPVTITTSN